jgi:hypothetical protein
MPSSAIDPSQVQWDAPPASSIDSSQVQWADNAPSETVGRVAGLGARALMTGTANLTDLAMEAAGAANPGATQDYLAAKQASQAQPYSPQLSDFVHPEKWQQAAEYFADKAGLPTPATPGERVASKAVEAFPSAVLAPEAPIAAGASAALGGAASQATAEAGGGPLAQTLAGLAGGSVTALPSAAAGGVRAITRGAGAKAAADMQTTLDNAATNQIPLTVGQASGSKTVQRLESASRAIWGGGPLEHTASNQAASLGNTVDKIVDNLAPGADVSPTSAGTAINSGVATAKQNMRAAEKAAYDKVDSLVPETTPVDVSGTLAKVDSLATPTPGAANTTGALISPKITQLRDNLKADIAANGGSSALPYGATTDLRTALGNSIDWGFAPSDPVTNGALKLVHGALKDDINASAAAISPQAGQAVTDARALYAQNQARRDTLNSIVDKAGGPEAVFKAATNGTKDGATIIGNVMSALDPGQQNLVRATVLDRLGRAISSQQDATGSVFSPSSFLTKWNNIDDTAKDALFGAKGPSNQLRTALDSLSDTIGTLRDSDALKNPSGTGEKMGHGFGLLALLEGGGAALVGHPEHLATVGGAVAGNWVLARALTNPRTARWLAQTTKLPKSALPNAVLQLGRMGEKTKDPDAQDLASTLYPHAVAQMSNMVGN